MKFVHPYIVISVHSYDSIYIREASELYFNKNISVSHIYNLIRSKSLNCIYIGHKILIPEEALESYCKANFNIKQENL